MLPTQRAVRWWKNWRLLGAILATLVLGPVDGIPSTIDAAAGGSRIDIYAAGIASADGEYPVMELRIDDRPVQTWNRVDGSPWRHPFPVFSYTHDSKVSADRVKVAFVNDHYTSDDDDRVLRVDKVVIDGVTFESEAPETHSVGSWTRETGCAPGAKRREWLDCNGYFVYASPASTPTSSPTAPAPTATPNASPTPAPTAPPSSGAVVWSSDHETGDFSAWNRRDGGGIFNSGSGQASISTDVAHSGTRAAKLTISTGDGAGHAVRIFRWAESRANQQAYYSAWYYFPQRYSGMNWWNIFQWKSKTPTRNDAFWQLNVGNRSNGNMYLYLYNWVNSRSYGQTVVDIPVGRWFKIEAYYAHSSTNSGRIVVWQDGVKLWDIGGVNTKYPDGDVQWSLNNYTDGITPSTATIYVDDAAIRTGASPD